MEYLFIEVSIYGIKVLLGVVYSPPVVSYQSQLETLVDYYVPQYLHFIVMGDFNTNLYKMNARTRSVCDIVNSGNLTPIFPYIST